MPKSKPFATLGSPPRVRGKALLFSLGVMFMGITPACAGKRRAAAYRAAAERDHPRVCGEKGLRYLQNSSAEGSPPRVRGKGKPIFSVGLCRRITPACAGKSRTGIFHQGCKWDHPRVCGEKRMGFRESKFAEGSPPRVRGKENVRRGMHKQKGITPACAGKRLKKALKNKDF